MQHMDAENTDRELRDRLEKGIPSQVSHCPVTGDRNRTPTPEYCV